MIDNITINRNDDAKLRAMIDFGETTASKQMELRLGTAHCVSILEHRDHNGGLPG